MSFTTNDGVTNLFPLALRELCVVKIWDILVSRGQYVERLAKQKTRRRTGDQDLDLCSSHFFVRNVQETRCAMVGHLASNLIDCLQDVALTKGDMANDGHSFCFSVLCNERLTSLHIQDRDWRRLLDSSPGSRLILSSLTGLVSLTIHKIANNDMLHIISNTCLKLCKLDISRSSDVSDLGLAFLSGLTVPSYSLKVHYKPPTGCKYLRELIFESNVMPRVTSYLLKHLTYLNILKFSNLHDGIQQYCQSRRICPLKLTHFSGPDDKIPSHKVCPKLRSFRYFNN